MDWSVIGSSASLAGYDVTEMGEGERILATNMIQWLHEKNTRVTLTNIDSGRPPLDFLDDALCSQ
jgi:hypothetical protein